MYKKIIVNISIGKLIIKLFALPLVRVILHSGISIEYLFTYTDLLPFLMEPSHLLCFILSPAVEQ